MKIECVYKIIDEDWRGKPEALLCKKITNEIVSLCARTKEFEHVIRFIWIYESIGHDVDDRALLRALSYLSGMKLHVLDRRFELTDNSGRWEISSDEIAEAELKHRPIEHPHSGEAIPDYKDKVSLYFTTNSQFFAELQSKCSTQ